MMTLDEAIRHLRQDPKYTDLVRNAYFDEDVLAAANRFYESVEFAEVMALLGKNVQGSTVLDIGAGPGIASYAFARSGAKQVYALEPDPSNEVGQGAIARLKSNLPMEVLDAFGEEIPLPDNHVDMCYARQVLHHIRDLPKALNECYRVLKPGGTFLACREHVVANEKQLATFLAHHPIHQLAGGENAYSLSVYLDAIRGSGLHLLKTIEPWDSVINAFPNAMTSEALSRLPEILLEERLGNIGKLISHIPGVESLIWLGIKRPKAG
jgi:SAM-dependent methyltransferase